MRTKVTLVLVFLNVALFFFIFKFERNWRTERATLDTRRRVLGQETTDIRSLDVTSAVPGGSFSLARRGDVWWLTKPLDWPANPHAVSTLITELQTLTHEASFGVADLAQNKQSLADYGLDQPKLTVAFTSGEPGPNAPPTPTLAIGDTTKDGNRLYVLSPDRERVEVVSRSLAATLALPLEQLRADALLTIPVFEARALSVQTAGVRLRIRREGTRWLFDTIIDGRANQAAIETTISSLNALHPQNFNPPNPPAVLPFVAPALRVTLEGNNRSETLYLGEPLGSTAIPTGPATAPDVEYYAQLDRRPALFTVAVPAVLMDALRGAQVTLREKHLLDFDVRAVTAITLETPVQPDQPPLTLQRLDTAASTADGAGWQVVRRGDATQGPQTLRADPAAVQRLLAQLQSLAAKNFHTNTASNADLEDSGFKRPERQVTLTLAGAAAPLVLLLGIDVKREVYALVGSAVLGSSISAVDFDYQRELRMDSRAWRERLLRELPATARITALKLTDLGTGQAVLDVALDAAGNPPADTRDAKAVRDLVVQFRSLRAKSFPQDGFAEKVFIAGEERPWKYRLDATVSLPGGAGGEQTSVKTLLFSDRGGGAQQLAGSPELDAVFEIEQPFLDALSTLTYGPHDPGPPPAPK